MENDAKQAESLGFHSLRVDDYLLRFNHSEPENRLES